MRHSESSARAGPADAEQTGSRRAEAAREWMATRGVGIGVTLAGIAFLLARTLSDVPRRPLFVDEVIAGLVAVRPIPDVIGHVLWDRGGAPLHFVLAHVAIAIDPSTNAVRMLSVVFAIATVPVCYDLGRRLGGRTAGAVCALVAATSSILGVYASMGRMYALFAFASALAADLFVRALDERTPSAAAAAAAAAWLLPAAHPYGIVVVGVEAAVALALWRGRPFLKALPVAAVGLALLPFVLADLQLQSRFGVDVSGGSSLAGPRKAGTFLVNALRGYAGGEGVFFALFLALAVAGVVVLVRRNPAFAAFAVLSLLAIPVALLVGRAGSGVALSTRHLIFGLPLWAALIGIGTAHGLRRAPRAAPLVVVGLAALAILAPSGTGDPRIFRDSTPSALVGPSRWVEERAGEGDVFYPYSQVYLAALPAAREALPVPANAFTPKVLRHAELPVGALFVAVESSGARVDEATLRGSLDPSFEFRRFRHWLLIRAEGPFMDERDVLMAAERAALAARDAMTNVPARLERLLSGTVGAPCTTLRSLGEQCQSATPAS